MEEKRSDTYKIVVLGEGKKFKYAYKNKPQ